MPKSLVKTIIAISLFLLIPIFSASALSPENRLADESQEKRALNLFLEVRCLVCNGQVIENSDSEFSVAMRELIRGKIAEGKDDQEIKDELIKKFGDDILVSNKFSKKYLPLFLLPLLFAIFLPLFLKKR